MLKKDVLINETASVKDALKKLNKSGEKVLLVADTKERLLGTLTDGDVRRYILSGKSLENNISEVYQKRPIYLKKKDLSPGRAKEVIIKTRVALLPILDEDDRIIDFITRDELLLELKTDALSAGKLNIPVVIMAGGKGARLDPFTKILPKPLIPIGDKPVIEIIIEEFKKHGVNKYYLTLNHKSGMIESYFEGIEKDYEIRFVREDSFLGTAGSLRLLKDEIDGTFIVSNCDVIVKADFEEVVNFHKEQQSQLTILAPIQHYKIPYGVVEFKEGGEVVAILEKPEYTFTINAGVYVLDRDTLNIIPENKLFHMTDLIMEMINNNRKVVMYPVNENDYIDIGQWDKYHKAINSLKLETWQEIKI